MQSTCSNYHRHLFFTCSFLWLFCSAALLTAAPANTPDPSLCKESSLGSEVLIDFSPSFIDHVYFNISGKFKLFAAEPVTFSLRPALGLDWQILRFRLLLSVDFFDIRQRNGEKLLDFFLGGGVRGEEISSRYQIVSTFMAGGDFYLNRFLMFMLGVDAFFFENDFRHTLSTDLETVMSCEFRF